MLPGARLSSIRSETGVPNIDVTCDAGSNCAQLSGSVGCGVVAAAGVAEIEGVVGRGIGVATGVHPASTITPVRTAAARTGRETRGTSMASC